MAARWRWLGAVLFLTLVLVGCADESGENTDSSTGAATDTAQAKAATTDLKSAIDKKDDTDTRLGRVLARSGPMLTSAQQSKLVGAFNALPDVVKVETDFHEKAAALATQLDAISADPMAIDQFGAKNLFNGYVLLTTTPSASSSLAFGTKVLGGQVTLDGVKSTDVLDQIVGASLAGAYLDNLLKSGDTSEAIKATTKVLQTGSTTCLQIATWLTKYNAFAGKDLSADVIGISSDSTVAGLRTIAGIVAIWTLGADVVDGDPKQLALDFLSSGPNAVNGMATATSLFRRVVQGIQDTPMATTVLKWSGRIATAIGFVTNAFALYNDSGKWNDSVDAKVRVMADIVALGASILAITTTGGAAAIVATVALGISWFADWLQNRRLEQQETADLTSCLPATGLDATLIKTLIGADATVLTTLTQGVKLTATDLQWLLAFDPSLATNANIPVTYVGVEAAQQIFLLDSAHTVALLQAATPDSDPTQLELFMRSLEFNPGFRADLTQDQALDWLESDGVSANVDDDQKAMLTAAMTGAHDYLQSVATQ